MTRNEAIGYSLLGVVCAAAAIRVFLAGPTEGSVAHMMEHCADAGGEWLHGADEPTCIRPDGEWLHFSASAHGFVTEEEAASHAHAHNQAALGEPIVAAATTEIDCGEALPEFADYPVDEVSKAKVNEPDFSTQPAADHHRTAISKDVTRGVNFAGHYVLAEWGCGKGCYGLAVVEAETGAIQGYGTKATSLFDYRDDSRLIGSRTEQGLEYFALNEDGKLVTICNQ